MSQISQLPTAADFDTSSLFGIDNPDPNSSGDYLTRKVSAATVADYIANNLDYTTDLDTTNKKITGAINELKSGFAIDSANSPSAIAVNGTYQIPTNVLSHTFIIIACRRGGYGNSIVFKKDELLTFDNGFTFLGTGGGYYTLKCSNTGLLTVTNITNLNEPYILVTGFM